MNIYSFCMGSRFLFKAIPIIINLITILFLKFYGYHTIYLVHCCLITGSLMNINYLYLIDKNRRI